MADQERGAMFDEFVEGGLLDDADVVIRTARFNVWDYKGKIPPPGVLALRCEMVDHEGKVHEQQMSSGELRFFVPSSDGRKAVPVGTVQKLNKNTNAAAFIMSIMNADTRGEMATKLRSTDDISVLDGLRVHVVRRNQPKRPGIVAPGSDAAAAQAADDDRKQMLVDRVLAYPWEAAGAGANVQPPAAVAAPAAVQAPAAAAPAGNGQAANGGVDDLAIGTILSIVAEAAGSIQKTLVPGKVYTHPSLANQPPAVKNAILGLVTKDEFLTSAKVAGTGIKLNAGVISLG